MTDNDLEKVEFEAYDNFYHSYFCSLLSFDDDGCLLDTGVGSGVLVTYRGNFFIATAGHVLNGIRADRTIISIGQSIQFKPHEPGGRACLLNGDFSKLATLDKLTSGMLFVDDGRKDVGLCRIADPQRFKVAGKQFFDLYDSSTQDSIEEGLQVEVWGVCGEVFAENYAQGVSNQATRILTKVKGADGRCSARVFLDYRSLNPNEGHLKHGKIVFESVRADESRHPGGMSGGPVWKRPQETPHQDGALRIFAPPVLIGIQTAYLKDTHLVMNTISAWKDLADQYLVSSESVDEQKTT
ncbi:MAG: hypothetical protein KC800_25365 [Candidatus Eremiobacteraeota bacterium]|nr:hypothetical protein [Candidatus Eremiobacteraeota bacterium]